MPNTAGAFLDRGITLAYKGEFESAIADFTQAIRLDPNNADARSELEWLRKKGY
jgi:Flp pilus assembly protein TadD